MSRYQLQYAATGLRLADTFGHQHPIHIDFTSGQFSYRLRKGGGKQEMLVKAVGAKQAMSVVDCTGGLGRDAFLLAGQGCNVTLLEKSRVMTLLLKDALARASLHEDLQDTVARIELIEVNAIDYLSSMRSPPDAITMDPMFPSRKKSARVKGDMQILQRFLGSDEDIDCLLKTAIATSCPRTVLKRPLHDHTDLDVKPTYSLKGSSVRFDVFVS